MDGLIMAGQLILSLAILVTLHEFGHYIAARAFGIRVEKFYLFFDAWGFKFFSFKKGDTEYGVGWLPLGGYVKISGMIDESMDKKQMEQPVEDWEFRSKPAWQRLIVMVGGVVMNVIVGIIIFSMNLVVFEKQYIPMDEVNKAGIYAYETGKMLGFETGDKIIKVNGEEIERYNDATSVGVLFGATITVERNGELLDVEVPDTIYREFKRTKQHVFGFENYGTIVDTVLPGGNAAKAGLLKGDKVLFVNNESARNFGDFKRLLSQHRGEAVEIIVRHGYGGMDTLKTQVDSTGRIGFVVQSPEMKLANYTLGQAIRYGTSDAIESMVVNVKGLGKVFKGEEKATEAVQGPIGIATMFGSTWDWYRFWKLTGLLSMILAFMNILPIPALDGGHVMFTLYEIVARRKPSDKFLEYAQVLGMVLLLALMVFAVGNDVYQQIINVIYLL
jgi:regulator of sigma E protease